MGWFIPLLISLAINVVAYVLTPKPKQPKPEAAKQLENPVAEAGKPIAKVTGTLTVSELNVRWFGEKSITAYTLEG
jgi:hypothetical protein